jgi:hypothetical protein
VAETMCCPLSNGDADPATVISTRILTAAKPHRCSECGEPMPRGTKHELQKAMWDERWYSMRTCLLCVEIRDHFACGEGYIYGEVWNQLEENFFPDMKAGGPCMEGLSPQAKRYLIDRRMAWYFDHDGNGDDDRWDGWKPPSSEATP